MRIACCNNEQTIEERHGGYPSAFRGEGRGRPIAIKVVRLYPTNDLEACLAVCQFQLHRRNLSLIGSLAEVL